LSHGDIGKSGMDIGKSGDHYVPPVRLAAWASGSWW
jgi:hypothetical protein